MIVPNQKVKVKWHPKNRDYYESLGFVFTKFKDEIQVKIEDLPIDSPSEVEIICDFCGKHHFNQYRRKSHSKNQFCSKDCHDNFNIGKESNSKLKLSTEDIDKIIQKKTNGKCMLIYYKSADCNMEVKCKCGNSFLVLFGNFKKGKVYCNDCLESIRKQKQFVKIVKFIHGCGNYVLSKNKEYENEKSLLTILCKCGEPFQTTFKRYKYKNKRQCNVCGYYYIWDFQKRDIKVVFELFENKGLIPMFNECDYKNTNSSLSFKCKIHINEGEQHTSYGSLVRDFSIGCKYCRNEKLRAIFKVSNPRKYFIDREFIPLFENDEYMNSTQLLPFICKKHELHGVQLTNLNNIIYKKGCKYCSDSKPKGEMKIQKFLDKKELFDYKIQENLPGCIFKLPLKFDFLIFNNGELKFIIEYDGIQHFEPVDFAGRGQEWAEKQLVETQKRDQIKNNYCKDNNIRLLRIPYWEYENIENILEFELFNLVI